MEQVRVALQAGAAPTAVLADEGYGIDTDFRDGVTALGLSYVVGIQCSTSLWAPGHRTIAAEALARHWPSTLADPP